MMSELKNHRSDGYGDLDWDQYASTADNLIEMRSKFSSRFVSEMFLALSSTAGEYRTGTPVFGAVKHAERAELLRTQ
ncbi:hypothetical protein CH282_14905 [Rhodococcus sp. 06-418-1B]|nr:hypothetical protein [Rhodococcus sp. 06-418-1B]OZC84427.1 hypothetical protein CH282_14905 [Rhodococcus sp. 06-418-1B]